MSNLPDPFQSKNLLDFATANIPRALELQLPKGLPLFQPRNRFAVLVNAYDRVNGADESSIAFGHARGSLRVYDMEALLSGHVALHPYCKNLMEQNPSFQSAWEQQFASVVQTYRSALPYEVLRLQGYENDRTYDFSDALQQLAAKASHDSVTFVYINAHGAHDGIEMVDGTYSYKAMFDQLENIPGKKVVGILAC